MKRFASAVIVLALCLAMLPGQAMASKVSPGNANRLSPKQAEAYYEVLRQAIAENEHESVNNSLGDPLYAQLIDFNQDHVPELYIITSTYLPDQIWGLNGDNAIQLFSGDGTEEAQPDGLFWSGMEKNSDIIDVQGKTCLVYYASSGGSGGWSGSFSVLAMNGNKFETIDYCLEWSSNTLWPEEYASYGFRTKGGQQQTIETTHISGDAYRQPMYDMLDNYNLSSDFITGQIQVSPPSDARDASTIAQLLLSRMSAESAHSALLNDLPYFGDVSKCRMSKELAEHYVSILNQITQNGVDCAAHGCHEDISDAQAILCDISGDGIPVLVVTYDCTAKDIDSDWEGTVGNCIQIWDQSSQVPLWSEQLYPTNVPLHNMDEIQLSQVSWGKKVYFRTSVNYFTTNVGEFPNDAVLFQVKEGEVSPTHTISESFKYDYTPGDEKQKWTREDYNHLTDTEENLNERSAQGEWEDAAGRYYELNTSGLDCPFAFAFSHRYIIDGRPVSLDEYNQVVPKYNLTRTWSNSASNYFHDVSQDNEPSYYSDHGPKANVDFALAPTANLISALSAYIDYEPVPTSSYPYAMGSLTDAQIAAIAKVLADRLGGEVTGVYQLADDLYYVVVTLPGGGYGGAVVKETRSGFRVLQAQETPLDDVALAPFAAEAASKPNLTVDYGQAGSFSTAEDYIAYLGQLLEGMDGTTPNDPARAELATYAETAVSRLSGAAIRAKRNHVTVTGASIESAAAAAREARNTFNRALTDSGVTLNKPITILLRIEGQNLDLDKPIQLTLDQTVADAMGEADAVQILLGDGRHSVKLTAASLRRLLTDYGAFSVQLAPAGEGVYTITFADGDGNTLDKLPTDVAFALLAESPFATVLASYQGGSDNWGGQYDGVNGTLEFSTKYSGQYEILKNDLDIADLGGCSDETQAAIRFMASKGYFDLTGDAFSPNDALTRYDFTAALVKMFFALDRSLGCTFPDVPADSPYLPYVASAEHGNIVEGYTDGTFSGGDSITGEQVLALCARTLAEQKGYRYPETPTDYLNFSGAATTSEWAQSAVALAIREGLVTAEESFDPVAPMTRAQSALVLYRMFMLLYETSPVAFSVSAVAADFPVIPVAVGGVILLSCAGGGAFLFLRKKKGSGIEEEEREG